MCKWAGMLPDPVTCICCLFERAGGGGEGRREDEDADVPCLVKFGASGFQSFGDLFINHAYLKIPEENKRNQRQSRAAPLSLHMLKKWLYSPHPEHQQVLLS